MNARDLVIDDATALLERAQEALSRGNVAEMLLALAESRFLDGLTRRLQEKWGDVLPRIEVDDCIAKAVDAACAAAFRGHVIESLGAWLWKSADNMAHDKWRLEYRPRVVSDVEEISVKVGAGETGRERREREDIEEMRRQEAIRTARRLLPRIGEGQIVDVMELVVNAAEHRLPDLPASSIATALGINNNAARSLVSRGMKKLRRLAKEEGAEAPTGLPESDTEDDEGGDDDA